MRISEMLKKKMSFSFEVFPPKTDMPMEPLVETLDKLYRYRPDFVSCTYGAGGTNKGLHGEICEAIQDSGHTALAHYTCIDNTKEAIKQDMEKYRDMGISNVLALRGDWPEGRNSTGGDFSHADRLIFFIKEHCPEICVGAACYPETHLTAMTEDADIAHLRSKQDNGAEFLMTQFCYNMEGYERFMDKLDKTGITLPIVVGVMPVLFKDGLVRMTLSNGCSIPKEIADLVGKYGDNKSDFKKAGKEYTIELIYRYINMGIAGLHIYSLNKYKDLAEIIDATGLRGTFVK